MDLEVGKFSEWVPIAFPLMGSALGPKLKGICRFRLLSTEPHVGLYVTPINIDPENPIMPISHPKYFATFLSKLFGRYATLGLAEDTWALNEQILDEDAFLEQAWANHDEREAQFFEMLKRSPKGLITCVFDGTDRIQHMFTRFAEENHPAVADHPDVARYKNVIEDTYQRMDDMIGEVMKQVDPDKPENLFAVISDHGFQSFRRGVNLNTWLHTHGYLALKPEVERSGEWFQDVDWPNTRAFAFGLGGFT